MPKTGTGSELIMLSPMKMAPPGACPPVSTDPLSTFVFAVAVPGADGDGCKTACHGREILVRVLPLRYRPIRATKSFPLYCFVPADGGTLRDPRGDQRRQSCQGVPPG